MNARYSALRELTLSRAREFFREPEAVFWVYVFPLLMAVALGLAFREKPVEKSRIDLVTNATRYAEVDRLKSVLESDNRFEVSVQSEEAWRNRLRSGKTDVVIQLTDDADLKFWIEPNRSESLLARHAVERALLRERVGDSAVKIQEEELKARGSRYIDFLIPGLLGMNLMGGGLFGVGFVIVSMRVQKLLKRYLATPMRRSDFLFSIMLSRMLFTIPEVLVLLLFGYLIFDVRVQGNFFALLFAIVLGATSFAGVGLLVASRAKTLEAASGLMNLVMLPMYILSGVFFSSERFPEEMQPFIKSLPLTALNDMLRGVMLDGRTLFDLWSPILVLSAWGVLSFVIALRWFRWK